MTYVQRMCGQRIDVGRFYHMWYTTWDILEKVKIAYWEIKIP